MATDGVFDNLYDKQISACIKKGLEGFIMTDLQTAADCVSDEAYVHGKKSYYVSPFAKNAHLQGVDFGMSGKHDDIVSIVAQIHKRNGPFSDKQDQEVHTNGNKLSTYEQEDL
jgi:hypothetical protein